MSRKLEAASANNTLDEQTWEAFKLASPSLQSEDGWTQRDIPPELTAIEEDSRIPEKLKNILAWSLVCSPPTPPPTINVSEANRPPHEDANHPIQSDGNEIGRVQTIDAAVTLNPQATNRREHDEALESQSVHSEDRPVSTSSSERRRFKARHIGNSVFGTTLDLISTFKNKVDRENSPPSSHKKARQQKPSLVECTSCFDEFPKNETTKLLCNHFYCKPCLTILITTALQSEATFPPKCCLTEIPLTTVLSPLNAKQRETYKEKAAEYAVPTQDRWYCPNTKCLKWIPPTKLHRLRIQNQKCPHCATKICGICRGLAHNASTDCPQDFGLEATINLAELEGWRRCFKCRAMVERTVGCRHMTCKCGAQFCYSCGARWRTCLCTELDDANRQAELRHRRGEREVVLDAEAAEIARIIFRIEEAERLEAEERQREEERLQEERRREEAELARLEEERLQEEETRRIAEEQMERELRQILRASVEESCRELQSALIDIMQMQKKALDSRHAEAERQHASTQETEMIRQQQENEDLLKIMESNIQKGTASIEEKHKSELESFEAEQQDLEDDLFLEIQMHLHGKKDKEARERRLQEKFQKQRADKLDELVRKHQFQCEAVKSNASMELQGVRLSSEAKLAKLEHRFRVEFEALLVNVASDRAWFSFLSERRRNMVAANNQLMLEAVAAGLEPAGLTEETAIAIGPFVPAVQDGAMATLPSPAAQALSTVAEQPLTGELIASPASSGSISRDIHPSLVEDPSMGEPAAASSRHMEMNSAFVWMTGEGTNIPIGNSRATERHTPTTLGQEIHRRPHVRRMPLAASDDLPEVAMSGAILAARRSPSRTHSGDFEAPGASKPGRRRVTPPSEGLQVLEPFSPPPPVPDVPAIFLPPRSPARERHPVQETQQAEKEAVIAPRVQKQRQRPTSTSSRGSVLTPSPSRSPSTTTSHRSSSSATSISRGSVDSLFLHTLVKTGTSTAAKPVFSPVSPVSPEAHRPSTSSGRSIWSFKTAVAGGERR